MHSIATNCACVIQEHTKFANFTEYIFDILTVQTCSFSECSLVVTLLTSCCSECINSIFFLNYDIMQPANLSFSGRRKPAIFLETSALVEKDFDR
jgi:hypothetical protein